MAAASPPLAAADSAAGQADGNRAARFAGLLGTPAVAARLRAWKALHRSNATLQAAQKALVLAMAAMPLVDEAAAEAAFEAMAAAGGATIKLADGICVVPSQNTTAPGAVFRAVDTDAYAQRLQSSGPELEPKQPTVECMVRREMKKCGHMCYPSNLRGCCACEDLRPVLPGETYTKYVDGRGYVDEGARDDGYCPICNDKNYEMWMKKMRKELEEKATQAKRDQLAWHRGESAALEDQIRAAAALAEQQPPQPHKILEGHAATATGRGGTDVVFNGGTFTYSNGDVYDGKFDAAGERSGWGKMTYADDPNSDRMETSYTTYEGEWLAGKHEGQGTKAWGDGVTYTGAFIANKMHGQGRYVMVDESCGEDVMEGLFANDEFVDEG